MVLKRVTGAVFAGNAALTNLGEFGSAADGQGINPTNPVDPTDPSIEEQIQTTAYEEGWTEAVVTSKNFPPVEEVNGVLRTISYQACYLLQEGIPVWDANTEYSNTSIVKVINGDQLDFYLSKQTQSGNIPQADDGTNWVKAIITGDREIGVPQITLDFTSSLPNNCVDLVGQQESITGDYSQLYSIYGTTYNDGTETAGNFRLPDFRGRAIYGGSTAGYISEGLPNLGTTIVADGSHTHTNTVTTTGAHTHTRGTMNITGSFGRVEDTQASGAFSKGTSYSNAASGSGDGQNKINFDASASWTGETSETGSHTHTVTINTAGSHTHSVTYTNPAVGSSAKIQTDGIKVRVYTRYK